MDTYRGSFMDRHGDGGDYSAFDSAEDEAVIEPPPSPVGQDERRMQVRAYNHWASLLDGRNFPSIEDLDPENLPDFGPYSVLLDFTGGIENPSIQYLGGELAEECGATDSIETLSDVPSRSLLSRITDHYMQILANQAPIGFEAEFVNQREKTILYRGILLPFSSDDDTIDFIYGVINWKELADQATTDELLKEIDDALETQTEPRQPDSLTDWADGPASIEEADAEAEFAAEPAVEVEAEESLGLAGDEDWVRDDVLDLEVEANDDLAEEDVLELDSAMSVDIEAIDADEDVLDLAEIAEEIGEDEAGPVAEPEAQAGFDEPLHHHDEPAYDREEASERVPLDLGSLPFDEASDPVEASADTDVYSAFDLQEPESADMGLADWLASARELAEAARGSEDRTRHALYAAISRAYDFSLAAAEEPEDFAELVADSGLTVQDRAPLIPVVKLVFGIDYDKTRLTEFATALGHAHRLRIERGSLGDYLARARGGLKGVVAEERQLKRESSGKAVEPRTAPREALARKLRRIEGIALTDVPAEGNEFTLLVARRLPTGEVVVLGEVADDVSLLERAARQILP